MIAPFATTVDPPTAAQPPPALPLEWFSFAPQARVIRRLPHTPAAEVTNRATYGVRFDGRIIALKYLRALDQANPRRPVMLLLHGMGVHIMTFRKIAPWLLETHDLLLVDYSGFSQDGGWPAGGESIQMLSRAAYHVPMALGLERFSVAGSSLGGGMALVGAIEHPDLVEKLVLLNPACYPQRLPRFYRRVRVPIFGELLMAALPPVRLSKGAAAVGYADPTRFDGALFELYTRNMRSLKNRLRLMDLIRNLPAHAGDVSPFAGRARTVRQPALVIWGEQDQLLPADTPQRLRADLPNVRTALFPDLSHLPHEEAPDRVGPVVAEFMNDK